jgi:hypothetical protein
MVMVFCMLYVSMNMKSSKMLRLARGKVLATGRTAYGPSLKGLVMTIGITIGVGIAMSVILTYIETGTFGYQIADATRGGSSSGGGGGGGNSASQGIGQSQVSDQ